MTFFEKIQAIERIDQLIRLKATGSPNDLAERIGVSRTTVYEIINCMKLLGADIAYCRNRQSFYYPSAVRLSIGFTQPEENLERITGGMKKSWKEFFPFGFSEQRQGIFEISKY